MIQQNSNITKMRECFHSDTLSSDINNIPTSVASEVLPLRNHSLVWLTGHRCTSPQVGSANKTDLNANCGSSNNIYKNAIPFSSEWCT